MAKQRLTIIADYTQTSTITLQELCDICAIQPAFINDLVHYDIIHPQDQSSEQWVFDLIHLERVKVSLRLHKDLDVNLAGVAVILDLLDQVHDLQDKMRLVERHYR